MPEMVKLELLPASFAVCQVPNLEQVDLTQEFLFIAKTDQELSLVCLEEQLPANASASVKGWRALRIVGQLDFALVGIVAGISRVLADASISVFVVSTYNTDYILLQTASLAKALAALQEAGYRCAS